MSRRLDPCTTLLGLLWLASGGLWAQEPPEAPVPAPAPAAAQPDMPLEAPPLRILRTGGLKVESAALLVSGEQGGSIHVAVMPLFVPAANSKVRVPVVLEIDGATLLKGHPGNLLRIEVCLYALSAPGADGTGGGSVQASLLETVEADLARLGADVERSGVQYVGELTLAAGTYSLRALVRNATTGEVGLRILPLTVPDAAAGPLLLNPVLPNPAAGSWVSVLSKTVHAAAVALADGGLPAAQPVLGVDQEARFEVPVWNVKAADQLRVEVLRPDGGRAGEFPAKITARREDSSLERLAASFVPSGLEPGRYMLRAEIPGMEAPAWSSPFVLLARGNEGKVWAELLHAGEPSPRQARAAERQPPLRRGPRLKAGPIRDAYRHALQLLAGGDEPAARSAVSALETPLFTGSQAAAPEDVREIELGVAQELAAAGAQSLLPLAVLHTSLYRDTQKTGAHLQSTHDREMVFAVADLYAEHSADAAERQTAARLLLGLTAQLVRSAPPSLCERALRQALTFDEDNVTARLYMAIDAERQGRYPEAVSQLERLLRSQPSHAEARLRLAVNLRRLGKTRDADGLLAGLIDGPAAATDPWLLALAYHEMGRALLASGRLDEAERTLRAGLKRLPGDEKLLFELSALFELRRDAAQARQVLAGFKPARDAGEAARHRYTREPTEALDDAWSDVQRRMRETLPALANALAPPAARKGS